MYSPDTTTPEQLTETSRLRVKYDTDASDPREDYAATGALTMYSRAIKIHVLTVYGFPGDLEHASDQLGSDTVRWARVFHDITLVWDHETGSYWWADPAFMAENHPTLTAGSDEYVAMEKEVIDADLTTYKTWANGDVYGVILERSVEWLKLDGSEDKRTEWDQADALFGCYLDEKYTAKQVAAEHFLLTDDETDACKEDA
jgi:hypothetical protein